ncbi:uncharacterized protein [Polyergus mexicanus]|uniref:uncharacterized protein n=1 Tax=Polyergus mexicanus TaxID=615972 RepID=UPI0038B64772
MPACVTTNVQLEQLARRMHIPYFRGVFMRNNLLINGVRQNESTIVRYSLGSVCKEGRLYTVMPETGPAAHGSENLRPPNELVEYFGQNVANIEYNHTSYQNYNQSICRQLCVRFLQLVDVNLKPDNSPTQIETLNSVDGIKRQIPPTNSNNKRLHQNTSEGKHCRSADQRVIFEMKNCDKQLDIEGSTSKKTLLFPSAEREFPRYFKDNHYDATQTAYENALDHMAKIFEEMKPVMSPNPSLSSMRLHAEASAFSLSHLPPIKLSAFDGNYDKWEQFRDRFTTLIRNNTELTDFARMHFLSSCLKGSALKCIANISITAANFEITWKALTSRYEDKKRSINKHLSTLINLSSITRESATEMQILNDKVNIAVASLKTLGRKPEELWDDILVHIIVQKLDPVTRKAWNVKISDTDAPPSYENLSRFIQSRTRALEASAPASAYKLGAKPVAAARVHVATASANAQLQCPLCPARHFINLKCFKNAPPNSSSGQASDSTPEVNSLSASIVTRQRSPVLLATAWVTVRRVVSRSFEPSDQDSEMTFISESLAQILRVKRIRMPISVSAVGGINAGTFQYATHIFISHRESLAPSLSTIALILKSLTSYSPRRHEDLSSLSYLSELPRADGDLTSSDPINLIIGADLYSDIIRDGVRKRSVGQPFAQNSIIGWIISGTLTSLESRDSFQSTMTSVHCPCGSISAHHTLNSRSLKEELRRFWEIEELPRQSIFTPQEQQCEEHFCSTHYRESDGRYIVRLPFKTSPPIDIGNSRFRAEKMVNSLVRRFRDKPELAKEYSDFISEYQRLGHMLPSPMPQDDIE